MNQVLNRLAARRAGLPAIGGEPFQRWWQSLSPGQQIEFEREQAKIIKESPRSFDLDTIQQADRILAQTDTPEAANRRNNPFLRGFDAVADTTGDIEVWAEGWKNVNRLALFGVGIVIFVAAFQLLKD